MPQPSTVDFVAPFDPTGFTSITGAQLLQLVSGLYPNTGFGLNIVTADIAGDPQVPDASATTKWQNYLWIRQLATSVSVYVWNPNGITNSYTNPSTGVTTSLLQWKPASSAFIGPGSITGQMIAPNTIQASNLVAEIPYSYITGGPTNAVLNNAGTDYVSDGLMNNNSLIFGVLNGAGSTVAAPKFGSQVIPSTAYGLQSISGSVTPGASAITDHSLTTEQLVSNGGNASTAATIAAVDPLTNIILPTTSIIGIPGNTSLKQAVAAGDVLGVAYNANAAERGYVTISRAILGLADPNSQTYGQIPFVAPGQTTYTLIAGQGSNGGSSPLGRILQIVEYKSTATQISNTNLALTGTTPTTSNTVLITGLGSTGAMAFTPLSTASTLIVEVTVIVSNHSSSPVGIHLFDGTTLKASSVTDIAAIDHVGNVNLRTDYQPGATTALSFGLYFAGVSGYSSINGIYASTTAVTALFNGGVATTSVKITEYI